MSRKRDEKCQNPEDAEVKDPDHSRDLLAAIIENSNDAIISKNLNSIITSWNGAATQMFGYTADEIIGQSVLKLIPDELRDEEGMILSKLRAGESLSHFETIRVKKNGERLEVSLTISPIRDRSGKVVGASKIIRDISKQKQLERLLIQSEKLAVTGRMAATVAHEINNPLEAVVNLIFLARTSSSIGKARIYLETAEKELERISHIVRQTLGYYRDPGTKSEVRLHHLIEEVLAVYQTKLRATGISVDCHFEDDQPITASKGELLQVFSNIISNSLDAMPNGGLLLIRLRNIEKDGQKGIEVIVKDQGIGIQKEYLSRVFEPFFTTKGTVGTGIGLWVAKQIVEKHQGEIRIASNAAQEDSGTSVSIFVPFAS